MITADRHCDGCDRRRECRATGGFHWFCRPCWDVRYPSFPWDDVVDVETDDDEQGERPMGMIG